MSALGACRLTVAIPARNEADRIAACLLALCRQRERAGGAMPAGLFDIVVFANDCSDRTADVARAFARAYPNVGMTVLEQRLPPAAAHVGTARRHVMDWAVARFLSAGRPRGIVATTDADTVVDPAWIAWTLHEMRCVDAVAGFVEIGDEERQSLLPPLRLMYLRERAYRRAFADVEALIDPLPHDLPPRHAAFVGASFAVTAATYRAVGGLPPEPCLEDRRFFFALQRIDALVRHSLRVRATTSARRVARVEGGFGTFIADLHERSLRGQTFCVENPRTTLDDMTLRAALRRTWLGVAGVRDPSDISRALAVPEKAWLPLLEPSATFGSAYERIARLAPQRGTLPAVPVEDALAALRAAAASRKVAAPMRVRTASGAG